MERLAAVVLVWTALGLAGCTAFAPRPRESAGVPARLDPDRALAGLVEAHNLERAKAGLPPLQVSERLNAAAKRHADDMAGHRRMSHRGSDGSSPFRRMERAGYSYQRAGENVAYGQRTIDAVTSAWMSSPGHRRNVLGKYSEIGTACATDEDGTPYWCVTFGTPLRR